MREALVAAMLVVETTYSISVSVWTSSAAMAVLLL
jgi:hypothetical protein